MRGTVSVRFIRVGCYLVNLEAVQQVQLRKDGSAELMLHGPKKSLQIIRIPAPAGRELWQFVMDHLAIVEFGDMPVKDVTASAATAAAGKKEKSQRKLGAKKKVEAGRKRVSKRVLAAKS